MRRSSFEDAEFDYKNQSNFGLSNVNIEQEVKRAPLGRGTKMEQKEPG